MVSETPGWRGWRAATEEALYGPDGFFRRPEGPAGHFRTSVHASPRYAEAVAELLRRVDAALGHPGELALVDIGAGRGELLTGVLAVLDRAAPPGGTGRETAAHGPDATATGRPPGAGRDSTGTGRGPTGTGDAGTPAITGVGDAGGTGPVPPLRERLRPYAVERAARPDGLDPRITWTGTPPTGVRGLLFANEWLDNVPVEVAETDPDGVPRQVLVAADGAERLGTPVAGPDARWLERWWPVAGEPGARAEIGRPRDLAWAAAVRCLRAGLAVAVDYAHTRDTRPPFGTLTGYREGREVRPVPDGGCDITAHVALDACAAAGHRALCEAAAGTAPGATPSPAPPDVPGPSDARPSPAPGTPAAPGTRDVPGGTPEIPDGTPNAPGAPEPPRLLSQRAALHALGLTGRRPPLALASTDPAGYVRALAAAGEVAELTDPAGLGAFGWLLQPVGLRVRDVLPDAPSADPPGVLPGDRPAAGPGGPRVFRDDAAPR